MAGQPLVCPDCRTWFEGSGRRPKCPSCRRVVTRGAPPDRRHATPTEPYEGQYEAPEFRPAEYTQRPEADAEWQPASGIQWGPEREVPPLAGTELERVYTDGSTAREGDNTGLLVSAIFGLIGLSMLIGGVLARSMLEVTVGLMIMGFALNQLSPEEGGTRQLPLFGVVSRAAFDTVVNLLKVTWVVLLVLFMIL